MYNGNKSRKGTFQMTRAIKQCIDLRTAVTTFFCIVGSLQTVFGSTLAFYDFSGNAEGTEATALVNAVDSALYAGTVTARGEDALTPVWTNNVPGNAIFSDATCTNMISSRPQAIRLSSSGTASASGGYIDLDGLGAALVGKKAFTVEWFWKAEHDVNAWAPIMSLRSGGLCVTSGIGNEYQCVYVTGSSTGNGDLIRWPVADGGPGATKTWNRAVSGLGWRHWAVVFEDTGADKVAKLYFDHDLYRVVSNYTFTVSDDGIPALRFGAAITAAGGVGSGRHGYISSIRVSDEALEPSAMMQMGVNAFYALKEGANGQRMDEDTRVENTAVPGTFQGSAQMLKNYYAKFSNDRPGKYIFDSSARTAVLATDVMSLQNDNADYWNQDQGYLTFAQLAGRLMTVANQRKHVFTLECFVKRETPFAWGNGGLFSLNSYNQTWKGIDNLTNYRIEQPYGGSATCTLEGETSFGDGAWHHIAFVFTPPTQNESNHKDVDVYVDYAKSTGQAKASLSYNADKFRNLLNDDVLFFGLASDKSGTVPLGKICAPRIRSGVLTPADFMVAADTLEKPSADAGFHWRFEDGTVNTSVAAVADGWTGEKWAKGRVTTYGTDAQVQPLYATATGLKKIADGLKGTVVGNLLSGDFSASAASGLVFLQTKEWCGLPYLHPDSWTLEFFAKADASVTRTADVLLAGRGRKDMSTGTDWFDFALVLQADGRLGLKGFRMNGDVDKTAFAFADIGAAVDGKWHAYAVTYEQATRTLSVFTDGQCAFSQSLESNLADSLKGRYIFASGCGQGAFAGALDEIRFVGSALSAAELDRRYQAGLMMLFR